MDLTVTSQAVSRALEPIAAQFRSMNIPAPITHWGHPLMMGIVVVAMGSAVAYAGWKGRTSFDDALKREHLSNHSLWARLMFLFIALGYTGGVLSLVMQHQSPLQSPHFWTGSLVILLLSSNAALSLTFSGDRVALRSTHAYLGSLALVVMATHVVFGLQLGLSF
ncbi:MAG: DUF4079 domain-containing protein [Cyanobacteria bacterium J06642_2]